MYKKIQQKAEYVPMYLNEKVSMSRDPCLQSGSGSHLLPLVMETMAGGQSPGSSVAPSHSPRPPSATLLRTLPGWNYSEVVIGSNLHFSFFFFFFFGGSGRSLCHLLFNREPLGEMGLPAP